MVLRKTAHVMPVVLEESYMVANIGYDCNHTSEAKNEEPRWLF